MILFVSRIFLVSVVAFVFTETMFAQIPPTSPMMPGPPLKEKPAGIYRRYNVKSAIIEFKYSGELQGYEKMYFENFGRKEAKFTLKMFTYQCKKHREYTYTHIDGDSIWIIDLDNKTGTRGHNAQLAQIMKNVGATTMAEAVMKTLLKMGAVNVGKEKVAGKMCEVWEVKDKGVKSWMWNSIPLKAFSKIVDLNVVTTAIRVRENVPIPKSMYKMPTGIKYNTTEPTQPGK